MNVGKLVPKLLKLVHGLYTLHVLTARCGGRGSREQRACQNLVCRRQDRDAQYPAHVTGPLTLQCVPALHGLHSERTKLCRPLRGQRGRRRSRAEPGSSTRCGCQRAGTRLSR